MMLPGLTPSGAPRTMLLTGASRGIGHGTVRLFAAAGWRVITVSRTPFTAVAATKCPWKGGLVDHVTCDLSDAEDVSRAIEQIKLKLGGQPLHALVLEYALSSTHLRMRTPSRSEETTYPHLPLA